MKNKIAFWIITLLLTACLIFVAITTIIRPVFTKNPLPKATVRNYSEEKKQEYMNILSPFWLDYTNGFGTDGWCLSLETSALLYHILTEFNPETIVDIGSGFSSFIIRKFFGRRFMYSVDDDPEWMKTTIRFLDKHNCSTYNIISTTQFREEYKDKQFDFILLDNDAHVRKELMSWVFTHSKIALVDDLHSGYAWYLEEIRRCEEEFKPLIFDVKDYTMDNYGRFAGVYAF